MFLSVIGENLVVEVKEVIEKERIDVNQLSFSGCLLLYKVVVVGDLESIYIFI